MPASAAAELHAKFSGGDYLLRLYVATALLVKVQKTLAQCEQKVLFLGLPSLKYLEQTRDSDLISLFSGVANNGSQAACEPR